jgi:hypothetical protein
MSKKIGTFQSTTVDYLQPLPIINTQINAQMQQHQYNQQNQNQQKQQEQQQQLSPIILYSIPTIDSSSISNSANESSANKQSTIGQQSDQYTAINTTIPIRQEKITIKNYLNINQQQQQQHQQLPISTTNQMSVISLGDNKNIHHQQQQQQTFIHSSSQIQSNRIGADHHLSSTNASEISSNNAELPKDKTNNTQYFVDSSGNFRVVNHPLIDQQHQIVITNSSTIASNRNIFIFKSILKLFIKILIAQLNILY